MLLRQGRIAEVRQLAEERIAVFRKQNLPAATYRALRLCAAAAQREDLAAVITRDPASPICQAAARQAHDKV